MSSSESIKKGVEEVTVHLNNVPTTIDNLIKALQELKSKSSGDTPIYILTDGPLLDISFVMIDREGKALIC